LSGGKHSSSSNVGCGVLVHKCPAQLVLARPAIAGAARYRASNRARRQNAAATAPRRRSRRPKIVRRTIGSFAEARKPSTKQAAEPLARRLLRSDHQDASEGIVNMGRKKLVMVGNGMAGVELNFDVEVMEVRSAPADEIAHGHVHGPGGHH